MDQDEKPILSAWISDRLPTREDADQEGEVQILWPNSGRWLYVHFTDVASGMPWSW